MFSIITIYKNKDVLEKNLLSSLNQQKDTNFEFIGIDNTLKRFSSAAAAFNSQIREIHGDFIIFCHQDVEFKDEKTLVKMEKYLISIGNCLGIAGVAGMGFKGQKIGNIWDCDKNWGKFIDKPEEAQTLDEVLFIIPKQVWSKYQFDADNFDGWHLYGADYCLNMLKLGLKVYVLPIFVYHHAKRGGNVRDLYKYQRRLYKKYRQTIYTTCGKITKFGVFNWIKDLCRPIYYFILKCLKFR